MDTPHWKDSRRYKQQARQLLALCQQHQLKITNLNANDSRLLGNEITKDPRPIHNDETVRERVLSWQLHLLELAHELGGPPLSIAVGELPAEVTEAEAHDQFRFHLEVLVKRSEDLQVPLSVEFEPDHFIYSWATLKPYIKEFSSDYFGVNFDIGHAACAGEDIVSTLKDARAHINNMHFEDIKDGVHVHLVPGNGNLPLDEVLSYLEKTNYDKGLTVELYNHSHRADAAIEETRDYFMARQA